MARWLTKVEGSPIPWDPTHKESAWSEDAPEEIYTPVPTDHSILYRLIGADRNSTASRNVEALMETGDQVLVGPGSYRGLRVTRTGDRDGAPYYIGAASGQAPLLSPQKQTAGSALYVEWSESPLVVEDLTLFGGSKATFDTENPYAARWNGKHPPFGTMCFRRVNLFPQRTGSKISKWLGIAYALGRGSPGHQGWAFEWSDSKWHGGFVPSPRDPSRIVTAVEEHGLYCHGVDGEREDAPAVLLRNLDIRHLGRTALQNAGRPGEGWIEPGKGRIRMEGCTVRDVCLQQSGGGSAITLKGNHRGNVEIVRNVVTLGCHDDLPNDLTGNITGCIVFEADKQSGRGNMGVADIRENRFEVGKLFQGTGPARRANLHFSAVDVVRLAGNEIISHPGTREAIRFEPNSVGKVYLEGNTVLGRVFWGEQPFETYAEFLRFALDELVGKVEVHPTERLKIL